MKNDGAYQGLNVADFSQGYAGPYCANILLNYGASVSKIEPLDGDWSRELGKKYGDQTAVSIAANRGKKSIALNLKTQAGLQIASEICERVDIIIESFRPGVMNRLGLSYESVRQYNENVIYASVSGYGQEGPYWQKACTDTVGQAFSGLMSINRGQDGAPHRVGMFIVDAVAALYTFQAISTALYSRQKTGVGAFIDCSLMQSAAALLSPKIAEYSLEGEISSALNAPAGTYATKDGFVAITLVKEIQFKNMAAALGTPELSSNSLYSTFERRAKNIDTLEPMIRSIISGKTTAEWLTIFEKHSVLSNQINNFGDWLCDPHVNSTQAAPSQTHSDIGCVRLPKLPGANFKDELVNKTAPKIGQHTREMLMDLGRDDSEINRLQTGGVVLCAVT